MSKLRSAFLIAPLLFATSLPFATAQNHNNNSAYYNGMRSGAHGGDYYNSHDRHYDNHYHDDHRQPNQGGIGPGKGALIGALEDLKMS